MDRALRVLVVEDSVADAEIDVLSLRSAGLEVEPRRAETEMEFRLALKDSPDVILCDHSLPSFDALRALKILQESNLDIPFIVVAGRIGEAAVADMMKAGAQDYVRKDSLARLAPAVRREVAAAEERERRRETKEKLQRQSGSLDSLMHNLPGMVYRLRLESDAWHFDFVSDGCHELTGYDRDTLIGGDGFALEHLLKDSGENGRSDELRHALESEGHFTLEHQIRCADGSVKWVWHRGMASRDRGGRLMHVDGFLADVTAQKVDQARLDYLAHHDVLTGLANRTVFEEELARSLQRVKRHFQNVTLLFIDLDNFKDINDTWGHQGGDAVLRALAGRLTTSSRKGDIVARLGGDEFALVMDDDEKTEDVAEMVPRLLEEIAQTIKLQGREVRVTASIGIAVYPVDGEDVPTLLKNADAAMYAAKQGGRNTFRFFAKRMNERAKGMVIMRTALQKALSREDFDLHFQPEVRLADRRIVAVEALVRWRRAPEKLMTAEHFIPFAGDAGVLAGIDRWVVRHACRQARDWAAAGVPFGRIACNLSPQALADPRATEQLEDDMRQFSVAPEWLEIEVTEAALMQDTIVTRIALDKIAELGVTLTLEDFGTGYSSLSSLKRYPIRRIKLDRDFTKDIPWKEGDVQVCRAILAMADSLRLEVVAVGVEQQEQAIFLHHAGCEAAQGFLFSPPLDAVGCGELLRDGLLTPGESILVEELELPAQLRL